MTSSPERTANRRNLGRMVRLLCAARDPADVSKEIVELTSAIDAIEVLRSLDHHRLTSCFYLAVRENPDDVNSHLLTTAKQTHSRQAAHHLRTLLDLRRVAHELEGAGIPWATFKGPILAETAYLAPQMRMYSDLDIVVSQSDVARAIEVLTNTPATIIEAAKSAHQKGVHQTTFELALGTPVDLHWDLLSLPESRRQFQLPLTDFLRNRIHVTTDQVSVWTFDREHTLLHLIAHAGLSGADRGIWIKDITEVLRTNPPELVRCADLTKAMHLGPMANVVLDRVRAVTGHLPDSVSTSLGHRTVWSRGLRLVEKLRPLEESTGDGRSGQLFVRSTRASTATSIVAFAADERQHLTRQRASRK